MRAILLRLAALIAIVSPVPLAADLPSLKVEDVAAWKRIVSPVISNDGQWFAYKLARIEGDSELVLTHLSDGKEQRFAIGEIDRPNPFLSVGAPPPSGPPRDVVFSEDSKWLVFEQRPKSAEMKTLRRQHKPIENKVILVDLTTGNKTDYDRVKRFSFSGERASALALHRYGTPGRDAPGSNSAAGRR